KKLHKSFYDRAFWGTDDYGQKWRVLHIYTDIIKNRGFYEDPADPIGNQPQLSGEFPHKRYLSPKQLSEYKKAFRQALEEGKKSPRQADRIALKDLPLRYGGHRITMSEEKVPRTPINIRTGRLAAA